MKRFAELYAALDSTTKTNEKVAALSEYFLHADPADAAWATYVLSGYKIKQLVATKLLRALAAKEAGIPDWLFDECYQTVGDLAETFSLVIPAGESANTESLRHWIESRLLPLRAMGGR